MLKFLVLSDLHINANDAITNTAGFTNLDTSRMLKRVKALYKEHILIVTGDIVDNQLGAPWNVVEFNKAYDLLSPFAGRIYLCPGNHDFGVLGNAFEPVSPMSFDHILAKRLVASPTALTPWSFIGDNGVNFAYVGASGFVVNLYALDTNKETISVHDFARGMVGGKQLGELNTRWLLPPKMPNEVRIVFFHHHPFLGDWKMELEDADKLRKVLAGKVDVACFGHNHSQEPPGRYAGKYGVPYWLASGASPREKEAFEITVEDAGGLLKLSVKMVPI